MANIIYSDEANTDIINIAMYYLTEFGVETADKVITSILDRIEILADYPDSGSETPNVRLNNAGFKKVVIENHVAIYSYDKEKNNVYVHHIYRASQNYG